MSLKAPFNLSSRADSARDGARAVLRDETLRLAVGTAIGTLVSGTTAAFLSGAWQDVLLGLAGLFALSLGVVLVSAGAGHAQERRNHDFERAQDDEAARRNCRDHELAVRTLITKASSLPRGANERDGDLASLLEMCRKHIATGHPSLRGLLFIDDSVPKRPCVLAQAGSFDQADLQAPERLNVFTDSLGGCGYTGRLELPDQCCRLVAVADAEFGANAQAEIQRSATYLQGMVLAHAVGVSSRIAG